MLNSEQTLRKSWAADFSAVVKKTPFRFGNKPPESSLLAALDSYRPPERPIYEPRLKSDPATVRSDSKEPILSASFLESGNSV